MRAISKPAILVVEDDWDLRDALSGTLEGGRPLVSVTVGAWAAESGRTITVNSSIFPSSSNASSPTFG